MTNQPPEPPRVEWTFGYTEPDMRPLTRWRVVGEEEWHESPDGHFRTSELPTAVDIEWRSGRESGRLRVSPWSESAYFAEKHAPRRERVLAALQRFRDRLTRP
jgi:hypothetical protein